MERSAVRNEFFSDFAGDSYGRKTGGPARTVNRPGATWVPSKSERKTGRDPEKRPGADGLRTVQPDPQLPRLMGVEPVLGPWHETHTFQQPPRHVLQAAEQLPDGPTQFGGQAA